MTASVYIELDGLDDVAFKAEDGEMNVPAPHRLGRRARAESFK